MAAVLAGFQGEDDTVARKAALFAYLDTTLGAARLLAELELPETLPELWNVKPVALPKHVWMYWHDGWDAAPAVAKLCLASWRLRNPQYEVHALDHASLAQFLSNPPTQAYSSKLNGLANRVRLKLLRTHGGVWADATLFCGQKLDAWLPMLMPPSRFFAFSAPGADRIVATWFLASLARAPLIKAWERMFSAYFEALESEHRWIHAYFALSYILEYTVTRHAGLAALFARMPKVPMPESGKAAALAGLKESGAALDPEQCAAIAATLKTSTVQKLTWKGAMRAGAPVAAQVLELLRENLEDLSSPVYGGR